jgi:cytochrome c
MLYAVVAATALVTAAIGPTIANDQLAPGAGAGDPARYGFGAAPSSAELERYFAIPPDGKGLPPGRGSYAQGQAIYAQRCAACHGGKLEGWTKGMMMPSEMAAMGNGGLIGGRGSLRTPMPVFTVESYWPYAPTLWDYIKRTMPPHAPGSLSDDEVYALVAYILGEANITPKTAVMDAQSLSGVAMPNRDGFVPDPWPELELFRQAPPSASPPPAPLQPAMAPSVLP